MGKHFLVPSDVLVEIPRRIFSKTFFFFFGGGGGGGRVLIFNKVYSNVTGSPALEATSHTAI